MREGWRAGRSVWLAAWVVGVRVHLRAPARVRGRELKMEPRQGTCARCPSPPGSPQAAGAGSGPPPGPGCAVRRSERPGRPSVPLGRRPGRAPGGRAGPRAGPWRGRGGAAALLCTRKAGDKGRGIYTVRGSCANFLCQTLPISISLETSLGSAKNFSDYLEALLSRSKISKLRCSGGERGATAKAKF